MKKAPLILSVSQPCHETWADMTPTEQGRFCKNCQKTVIDFAGLSDQEIISFVNNRKDNVCGRFLSTQLNRPLLPPVTKGRFHKLSAAIITFVTALTVMMPSVRAQKKVSKVSVFPDKKTYKNPGVIGSNDSSFKKLEIFPINANRNYQPKVRTLLTVSLPVVSKQTLDSNCGRMVLGGVLMPGVKIQIREESVFQPIKTSIVDFF